LFSGTPVNGGGICRLYFDETAGTAAQAHSAVVTFWNAIRVRLTTALTINVTSPVDIWNFGTQQVTSQVGVVAVAAAGTNGSEPLPPANQARIDLSTGVFVNGHQMKGRIFVPGCVEADAAGGGPLIALTGVTNAAISALIADANSTLSVNSPTYMQGTPVTSGLTWTKFAVLRSRRD